MDENNNLLREIESDIKQERFETLFIKNGGKLIAGAVFIVALTAALTISKNISNKNPANPVQYS